MSSPSRPVAPPSPPRAVSDPAQPAAPPAPGAPGASGASGAPGAPAAHRVVVLALEPVIGYDMAIPPLIFGAATDEAGESLYEVSVASLGGRPVPSTAGYAVLPAVDEAALATADTVIVPGTRMPQVRREGVLTPQLAAALALVPAGARWMSICTGAFVLGAAGLLDGRRATTHWRYADDLARLHPRARIDPDVLFVDDDEQAPQVLTSAGLAAGTDLCLHVVRRDHGASVANGVARHCVVPPWREGGQAQFIDHAVPPEAASSTAAARQWALTHLDEPLDVTRLARRAGMSVRTFARRFRAETGQAPGAWLIEQRVRRAQHLLESSDLPVEVVAERAGLGTSASLRQHLRAVAGVSPTAYRRTFRGAESGAE